MSTTSYVVEEQPTQGVIMSPNGELQYFSRTNIKNKNNPYLNISPVDEENGIEYTEIICNGERIIVSVDSLNQAIYLEWNATIVRVLCLIDFIMNIFISFDTNYIVLYNFIVSIISLSGYFSTLSYNKYGLVCYLIYQYIQSICKITLIGIYIASISSKTFYYKMTKNNILIDQNLDIINLMIIILSGMTQIYITYFVHLFYNMLPRHNVIHHNIPILDSV